MDLMGHTPHPQFTFVMNFENSISLVIPSSIRNAYSRNNIYTIKALKNGIPQKIAPPPQETLNDFDHTVQVYLNWIPDIRDATLTQNS